jgi:hypothetical protein
MTIFVGSGDTWLIDVVNVEDLSVVDMEKKRE